MVAVPRITAFVDEGLGHSSYLVEIDGGGALVIDPPRFPDPAVFAAARDADAVVADTHTHADYVSGAPELVATGAVFVAPRDAAVSLAHEPMDPGSDRALDDQLALRAIATPGHTPDHLAYLLHRGGEPVALFSGGSLMVGTVGRTDLFGRGRAAEFARQMYRALVTEILTLPDDLPVYPTHGAGSFCSAPGATERTTTIGRERRTNPLLLDADEDTFVARVVAGLGSFPKYYARLPELNRHGVALYGGTVPELPALSPADATRAVEQGALVVDTRPIAHFAAGHLPGSLSNALRPVFGSWLAWLVDADRPLVFITNTDEDRAEVARQALTVGMERLVGVLDGGVDAWRAAGRPLATVPLVAPDNIEGTLVDVRQRNEFDTAHVPGAHNIELGSVTTAHAPDGRLTIMCGHGERAMTAASLLRRTGIGAVRVVDGGPADWAVRTGTPLQTT